MSSLFEYPGGLLLSGPFPWSKVGEANVLFTLIWPKKWGPGPPGPFGHYIPDYIQNIYFDTLSSDISVRKNDNQIGD